MGVDKPAGLAKPGEHCIESCIRQVKLSSCRRVLHKHVCNYVVGLKVHHHINGLMIIDCPCRVLSWGLLIGLIHQGNNHSLWFDEGGETGSCWHCVV